MPNITQRQIEKECDSAVEQFRFLKDTLLPTTIAKQSPRQDAILIAAYRRAVETKTLLRLYHSRFHTDKYRGPESDAEDFIRCHESILLKRQSK